jgi:anti-anti-sigma factor
MESNIKRLKEHVARSVGKSQAKTDIELSRRIYEQMLLAATPKKVPTLDIAPVTLPSSHPGGSFYDFFQPSPDHFDLAIGDIEEGGETAAMIALSLKSQLLRFAAPHQRIQQHQNGLWKEDLFTPGEIVSHLHEATFDQLDKIKRKAAIFYGKYDIKQRKLTYLDCGFARPILFSEGKLSYLEDGSDLLGTSSISASEEKTISYKPGDLFVFYSKSALESTNDEGIAFGTERLEQIIHEYGHLGAHAVAEACAQGLMLFTGSTALPKDVTFILIKVTQEPLPQVDIPTTAKFHTDISQLAAMRDFVYRVCLNSPGNSERLSQQMQLAINEIFCNIVKHGLASDAYGDIVIQASLGNEGITFDIADQGPSYDPELINEPSLAGDREDGYGWYLIKKIVDQITYSHKRHSHGWNHLILYKTYETKESLMEISHTTIENILVIKPEYNTLDAKEVPDFKAHFQRIVYDENHSGTKSVVLDMSNLDFIDSSGLGSLLSVLRSLRDKGGQLKLAGMKKPVFTIFELVSMNKAFETYDTVDLAVKSFNKG